MNKVLVALAFAGVAATGTIGTFNESDIESVGSAFGEVKKEGFLCCNRAAICLLWHCRWCFKDR